MIAALGIPLRAAIVEFLEDQRPKPRLGNARPFGRMASAAVLAVPVPLS